MPFLFKHDNNSLFFLFALFYLSHYLWPRVSYNWSQPIAVVSFYTQFLFFNHRIRTSHTLVNKDIKKYKKRSKQGIRSECIKNICKNIKSCRAGWFFFSLRLSIKGTFTQDSMCKWLFEKKYLWKFIKFPICIFIFAPLWKNTDINPSHSCG